MAGLLENIKNRLDVGSLEYCERICSISQKLFGYTTFKIRGKVKGYIKDIEITSLEDCVKIKKMLGSVMPDDIEERIKEYVETVEITSLEDCMKIEEIFGSYYDMPPDVKDAIIEYIKTAPIRSLEECIKVVGMVENLYMHFEEVPSIKEYWSQLETVEPSKFSSLREAVDFYEIIYKDRPIPDSLLKQLKKISKTAGKKKDYGSIPVSVLLENKKNKLKYLEKRTDGFSYQEECKQVLRYTPTEDRGQIADSVISTLSNSYKTEIISLCSTEYIEAYIKDENSKLRDDGVCWLIEKAAKNRPQNEVEKLVELFIAKFPEYNNVEELVSLCSFSYIAECMKNERLNMSENDTHRMILKISQKQQANEVEELVKIYIDRFPNAWSIEELLGLCSVEYIVECMKNERLNMSANDTYRMILEISQKQQANEVEELVKIYIDRFPNVRSIEELLGLCSVEYIIEYIKDNQIDDNLYELHNIINKVSCKKQENEIEKLVKTFMDKFPKYSANTYFTGLIGLCSTEYIIECMENEKLNLSEDLIYNIITEASRRKEAFEIDKLATIFIDKFPNSSNIRLLINLCSTEYIIKYMDNPQFDLSEDSIYMMIWGVGNRKDAEIDKLVKSFTSKFPDSHHIEDLVSLCSAEYIEQYMDDPQFNLSEDSIYRIIWAIGNRKDAKIDKLVKSFTSKFPDSHYIEELVSLCSAEYIEQYIDNEEINLNGAILGKLLLDMIAKINPGERNDAIKKYIHKLSSKDVIESMLKELTDYQYAIDYLRSNKEYGIDVKGVILYYFAKDNDKMFEISSTIDLTQKDEMVEAILYAKIQANKVDIAEKITALKVLLGEEKFNAVLEGKLGSISSLLDVMKNIDPDKMVKTFDIEFIKHIGGIDSYTEFIKYSSNNINFSNIIDIVGNGKCKEFLEFYTFITTIIPADGVKRFEYLVKLARLYTQNESFCNELKSKELSIEDKNNIKILLAGEVEEIKDLNFEEISNMFENKMETALETHSAPNIQDSIFKYLMGYGNYEVGDILRRYMSVSKAIRIRERAEKKGDTALIQEAKLFEIMFEVIEQINNCEDLEKLRDIVEKIQSMDSEKILELRLQLRGIKEKIRTLYEHNAESELTDISKMLPKDIDKDTVPVVDLSNREYLIYMHATERSPENFVAESLRRNTNICVSPNSDEHLAFYYGGRFGIRIGFTKLPTGAFIGSSPTNMSSNGSIGYNDFDIKEVSRLFQLEPIRDSFADNSQHGETILFTHGLLPTCIVMRDPSDAAQIRNEEEYAKKLQELIRESIKSRIYEGMPEDEKQAILEEADSFIISLVKTQKVNERVVNYTISEEEKQNTVKEEKSETGLGVFDSLRDLLIDENSVIVEGNAKYVYDGKIYSKSETPSLTKAIQKLQDIVYTGQEESRLRTIEINGELLVEAPQSKANLEGYTRDSGEFAKKTYEGLLTEFLMDHLIASYLPSNDSFSINSDGTVYRFEREGFTSTEDLVSEKGNLYTGMTYYRFDRKYGNNLYRKMFEQHIEKGIFTDRDWGKLEETARRIKSIPPKEYNAIFEDYINTLSEDKRDVARGILASRRYNIVEDIKEFRDRIESLRKEREEIPEFEDGSKIAFINDIHGNFEALKSLVENLEKKGKTDIFILGDIIGFGAQSNECLDFVRKKEQAGLRIKCLLGNHELYVLMGNQSNGSPDPQEVEMDINEISPENRRYMESMLMTKRIKVNGKLIELVHFPQTEDFVDDKEIFKHGGTREANDEIDYVVYGHEHLTEGISEVIQPRVDGQFINLPSSGCVHGQQTTYSEVGVGETGDLVFRTIGVEYDYQKNSSEIEKKRPSRGNFFYR